MDQERVAKHIEGMFIYIYTIPHPHPLKGQNNESHHQLIYLLKNGGFSRKMVAFINKLW